MFEFHFYSITRIYSLQTFMLKYKWYERDKNPKWK